MSASAAAIKYVMHEVGDQGAAERLLYQRRASLANASDGPGTGNEMMLTLRVGRQTGPNSLTELRPPLLVKRHRVARRGCLAAQEWRPVVVEVPEDGWYVDGTYLDLFKSRRLEE